MARRRRPLQVPLTLILDSGAVIAESRGNPRVRTFIRQSLDRGTPVIVPAIVVTETFRDDPTDVRLNCLLRAVLVSPTDFGLARVAGRLLAITGTSNAPDAQVVAEALRRAPSTILTSDKGDIITLVGSQRGITVKDVNEI